VPGSACQNLGPGQARSPCAEPRRGQIARTSRSQGRGWSLSGRRRHLPVLFTPDLDLFDVSRVKCCAVPRERCSARAHSRHGALHTNQPTRVSSTFGEAGINTIEGAAPGNSASSASTCPWGQGRVPGGGLQQPHGGLHGACSPTSELTGMSWRRAHRVRAAFRIAPSGRFSITPGWSFRT